MHAMRMQDKKSKDGKGAMRIKNKHFVKIESHQRKRDEMREANLCRFGSLDSLYQGLGAWFLLLDGTASFALYIRDDLLWDFPRKGE